jgi:alkylation response protein AidB-like acyl-CoA dehydrogenase
MEAFPWWTKEQIAFAAEVKEFAKKVAPIDAKSRWTREFPFEIYRMIGEKGFMGAAIPKEYGGLGLGATGACILAEELHSLMPGIGRIVVGNMNGGLRQIIEHATEEQKKRFLPKIASGEIGAVAITEMTAGTDAAGVTLVAKKEGDHYVLNGRKRFIVGAGVADRYFVYAQTSSNPDDIKTRKHVTAFLVYKGAPGFTTEKINEILAFENVQNGSLDFDNVKVPVADRIGEEGEAWEIMMNGLNFERTVISAGTVGWQRLLLNQVVPYSQRRVQFGKPTIDISSNQDKIANIVMRLKVSRIAVYYTAWLWDMEKDVSIEASTMKAYGAEITLQSGMEATQIMAGDGVNRFYPVQNVFEVAKTEHIAGGTVEACRLTIFRSALKLMKEDIQMTRRVIDEEIGVPIPDFSPVKDRKALNADSLLKLLGDDYRVNQGLHMTPADVKVYLDGDDGAFEKAVADLEAQGLVMVIRNKKEYSL